MPAPWGDDQGVIPGCGWQRSAAPAAPNVKKKVKKAPPRRPASAPPSTPPPMQMNPGVGAMVPRQNPGQTMIAQGPTSQEPFMPPIQGIGQQVPQINPSPLGPRTPFGGMPGGGGGRDIFQLMQALGAMGRGGF